MEEPTNYCEDKQPIINDAITITFITPQDKQSFAKKNRIIYSISSPSNIKKVNITLDGKTLHSYIDNSTEIF
ncbi:MAG: hypothetical protein Q4B28_00600 [bacterium]|nr:hypothetical protein [bacterium]